VPRLRSRSAFLLILWAGLVLAVAAGAENARVDPALREAQAAAAPGDSIPVRVVLRYADLAPPGPARREAVAARQGRVLAALPRVAAGLKYRHRSLPGFAASIPADAIDALARHPDVVSIHADGMVYASLAQGAVLVGAADVRSSGITGEGVTVAVLDSGIDTDHPNLSDDLVAEYCACDTHPAPFGGCCPNGQDEQTGPGSAEDGDGHGTSVAGIITSSHANHLGVAPDAGVVAIKVLSDSGGGRDSGIDAGLDWVLTNRVTYGIRVVNMSLGDASEHDDPSDADCSSDPTSLAIASLHAAGISVFVASGNQGHDNGIAAPACTAEAISVGGVYDESLGSVGWCANASCSQILCTDTTGVDRFVCHSNSDEILDLLAPDYRTGTTALGGGLETAFGGTSAASPYAAAQAALLLEFDPTLTPEGIRTLLTSHAAQVTNPDNGLSFPRSDVQQALSSLRCGNGSVEAHEDCDPSAGSLCCTASCTFESAGTTCSDGSLCTLGDTCDASGTCAGAAITCDDANACTDDSCDPGLGCVASPNTAPCDDANACTSGDVCVGGSCVAGAPLVCDDANVCTDDSCSPSTGCVFAPNLLGCDDGNACTSGDICSAGSCAPGGPVVCDDANLCTTDGCDSGSGCVFVPNALSCSDGDACTSGDVCSAGSCNAGGALDCDDGDPCTGDGCDALAGCFHTPVIGCVTPAVPALSGGARALLVGLLVAAGLGCVPMRRRRARSAGAAQRPGTRAFRSRRVRSDCASGSSQR
jgi:subtilisin family serine protease